MVLKQEKPSILEEKGIYKGTKAIVIVIRMRDSNRLSFFFFKSGLERSQAPISVQVKELQKRIEIKTAENETLIKRYVLKLFNCSTMLLLHRR
jgi:hypothetical protein